MAMAMHLLSTNRVTFSTTTEEDGFNNQVRKSLILQLARKDQCGLVQREVKFSEERNKNGNWFKVLMLRESVLDQMAMLGLLIASLKSSNMMANHGRDKQEVLVTLVLEVMDLSGLLVTQEQKRMVALFTTEE